MPTIPVYLKDRVYMRLAIEADRLQMSIGKLCSTILEQYVEYLERGDKANVEKEVPTGRRDVYY